MRSQLISLAEAASVIETLDPEIYSALTDRAGPDQQWQTQAWLSEFFLPCCMTSSVTLQLCWHEDKPGCCIAICRRSRLPADCSFFIDIFLEDKSKAEQTAALYSAEACCCCCSDAVIWRISKRILMPVPCDAQGCKDALQEWLQPKKRKGKHNESLEQSSAFPGSRGTLRGQAAIGNPFDSLHPESNRSQAHKGTSAHADQQQNRQAQEALPRDEQVGDQHGQGQASGERAHASIAQGHDSDGLWKDLMNLCF